jgi:hypothetical protein
MSKFVKSISWDSPFKEQEDSPIKKKFHDAHKRCRGCGSANNNIVQESQLSEEERNDLYTPVTVLEFEQLMNSANMKSS